MNPYKFAFFLFLLIGFILFAVVWVQEVWPEEIPDHLAIRAIIGEASGEGFLGMKYVAAGIRNRGHLRGVYGLKAKHVDKEPHWVWVLARKAWAESEHNRLHSGTHWESTDFAVPSWAQDMVVVCKHKKHIFYKSVK